MKIVIAAISISVAALVYIAVVVAEDRNDGKNQNTSTLEYVNTEYGYRITHPEKFSLNSEIAELVVLEYNDDRLRINSGCYESGTEGFGEPVNAMVTLNGISALKEDYYASGELMLRRVSFEKGDGRCFLIEEVAETEEGWQELLKIRNTFRLSNGQKED